MKGPSLQYDVRALRVFRCSACGRTVQTRGSRTHCLCECSVPPKFMTPQERPKTQSPDVTTFITVPSEPDPPEEEIPEESDIPYIPRLPARPPQYPARRKLVDDIEKYQPPEFGSGVDAGDTSVLDQKPTPESPSADHFSPQTQDAGSAGRPPASQPEREHRRPKPHQPRSGGKRGPAESRSGENPPRGLSRERDAGESENSRRRRRRGRPDRSLPPDSETSQSLTEEFGSGVDQTSMARRSRENPQSATPKSASLVPQGEPDREMSDGVSEVSADGRPPARRNRRRGRRGHRRPGAPGQE